MDLILSLPSKQHWSDIGYYMCQSFIAQQTSTVHRPPYWKDPSHSLTFISFNQTSSRVLGQNVQRKRESKLVPSSWVKWVLDLLHKTNDGNWCLLRDCTVDPLKRIRWFRGDFFSRYKEKGFEYTSNGSLAVNCGSCRKILTSPISICSQQYIPMSIFC